MKRFVKLLSLFIISCAFFSSCDNDQSSSLNVNSSDTSSDTIDITTSTHEHTFASTWEYDETYHWHPSTCGHNVRGNEENHIFTYIKENNKETYTCSICNYSYVVYDTDFLYEISTNDGGEKYISIIRYTGKNNAVIIPETINVYGEDIPVKEISSHAFWLNDIVRSIFISDGVATIDSYAFYNCYSLTSIFIPNSVTSIDSYAFNCCFNLTIYCEASSEPEGWANSWNDEYYPEVWSSYLGINGILDGLKYAVCIDDENSKYLTITSYTGTNPKLIIPSSINVNGEDIPIKVITNDAFVNNETITSVNIPSNVVIIDNYAFAGCSSLNEVIIEENTQLISLGWSSFRGCSSLTSIYIPDSVITIGGDAFSGCSNLTIYCEVSSQPSGWHSWWNYSNRPVVWSSYKGIYGNLNGLEYISNLDNESNPYITITGYTGSSANVVIPSLINVNGGVIPVKVIGRRAFYNNDTITSVVIPDSVATIGSSAFSGCSNLTTVTISENSQLTSIGYNAFSGCSSLTSIYIPDSVTTIGEYAFVSCSNLIIVTISENSQLTTIGEYAFSHCSSLTSIYIPDSVTTIEEFVFYNCSKLTIYCEASSEPSGWAYSWNIFSNSSTLLRCSVVWNCISFEITDEGFHLAVVLNANGDKHITIVGYSSSSTNVVIPSLINVNEEVIPVKVIGRRAFYNNDTIISVAIPNSVATIGFSAFYNCSSLTSIFIPNSVTAIGSEAFYECDSLTSIYIPNSVTSIGSSAFYGCFNLTICCEASSEPSGWSSSWNYSNRPVVWSSNGHYREYNGFTYGVSIDNEGNPYITITSYTGSSTNIVIPSSINVDGEVIPVKVIADNAFFKNETIASVTIPDSVTSIGKQAFGYCSNLATVTISENSQLISIGEYAFYECSSLTSIFIPYNVATIGEYAFISCSNLTIYCEKSSKPNIWDDNWNSSNRPVVWSSNGQYGEYNGFIYGVSIDNEGNPYITIAGYNSSSTNVTIPSSINVDGEDIIVKEISDKAFYKNKTITSVAIPDSVTAIGVSAFYNCSNLTTVTISENSQLTTIGEYAFKNCFLLTSIYIPNSVTTIGDSAFFDCYNLTIYCQASSKPSGWDSDWNYSNCPVVWNTTYDEYLEAIE